jgi:hypothetical protein
MAIDNERPHLCAALRLTVAGTRVSHAGRLPLTTRGDRADTERYFILSLLHALQASMPRASTLSKGSRRRPCDTIVVVFWWHCARDNGSGSGTGVHGAGITRHLLRILRRSAGCGGGSLPPNAR